MRNKPTDLLGRTKDFAIEAFRIVDELPGTRTADVIGRQLAKSASSPAANYREARRARSPREFASKVDIALQEAEEARFWLEIAEVLYPKLRHRIVPQIQEAGELIAIFTASSKTIKRNLRDRRT